MNRKKNKKNKILKIMTLVFTILLIIPFSKVDAGVTDCTTESGCTTNSKTTLVKTETTTEEVSYDTDLDAYIANKKASDPNLADSVSYKNEWEALYVSENGVYKYPVFIQTVFTGVTYDGVTYDNDSILVGDPSDITIGIATYNYETRYREVTVTKAANPYEIKRIDLTVDIPKVGDEITLNEDKDWDSQRPQATITVPSGSKYELAGNDEINYMYYIESLDQYKPFEGKFEKDKTYYMEIWLNPLESYFFTENIKIYVNGVEYEKDEYEDDEITVLYDFKPKVNQKEYTISNDNASATFTFDDGYDFKLTFIDVLSLTKDQREEMDIDEDEYNKAIEIIKNNVKSYGSLIGVYTIEINDENIGYTDSVKIKLKMTDEMKKYNSFKFIYIDDNNNYKVGDIVDLEIKNGYLYGTLPHLSAYALVGNTVDESKINNPATGDNIMIYALILLASLSSIIVLRKRKNESK